MDLTPRNLVYVTAHDRPPVGRLQRQHQCCRAALAHRPDVQARAALRAEIGQQERTADRKLTANGGGVLATTTGTSSSSRCPDQLIGRLGDPAMVGAAALVRFNAAKSHVWALEADGSCKLPLGLVAG